MHKIEHNKLAVFLEHLDRTYGHRDSLVHTRLEGLDVLLLLAWELEDLSLLGGDMIE